MYNEILKRVSVTVFAVETARRVCLYSCLRYLARGLVFSAPYYIYCHLWPVCSTIFFHIIS
jgi:hypothetical protein